MYPLFTPATIAASNVCRRQTGSPSHQMDRGFGPVSSIVSGVFLFPEFSLYSCCETYPGAEVAPGRLKVQPFHQGIVADQKHLSQTLSSGYFAGCLFRASENDSFFSPRP